MKKRKICAMLLAATMVAGSLAGCGDKKDDTSKKGNSGTEGGEASGDVIELTFFSADANQDDPWTDPVAEAITEATGVK